MIVAAVGGATHLPRCVPEATRCRGRIAAYGDEAGSLSLLHRRETPVTIRIPDEFKPADGRFGCGPGKVRPEAVQALAGVATTLLGTSHRQKTVKDQVARLRRGIAELFSAPEGYE